MTALVPTIGLEIHVQLRTRSKIWCACPVDFGAPPNTQVCPVCLGHPGSLPVLNREAVRLTARTGLLLDGEVATFSKHDRKSYFYPDMPKNYQITQYDQPLVRGGCLEIETAAGKRVIRLNRIHLEEDVGKSNHFANSSGMDFNRAGTPLMEIVTEADLHSPDEALDFLTRLKQVLVYGGVTHGNLEQGNIRCDVNTSVAPAGAERLGVKTEIKNMNTFRGVHRALTYEIQRQIDELGRGGRIVQETRRWDDDLGITQSMRVKEHAHDYRYFPDPDLPPVVLEPAQIEAWRAELPERPDAKRARFVTELQLPEYDAGVLAAEAPVADYFEAVVRACGRPKEASNWVMGALLRLLTETGSDLSACRCTPENLAAIIGLVEKQTLNRGQAKELFALLFAEGGEAEAVARARGMVQVSDAGELEKWVESALAAHPASVADYRAGKKAALQHLMGQVMRLSKGKANPQTVAKLLAERLGGG
jgi:aspartyl-tRNA(Asn)/glutamyl-tRNA(Gln) amidotransferase subunit B